MAEALLYFLVSIGATTAGSLTGMGGGVIIKPLLDALGGYSVETIGLLSSIAVLTMSMVSIGRHLLAKTTIPFRVAVPLACGAVAGGILGENLLRCIITQLGQNRFVTVVQNISLAVLILGVFLYMKNKDRIPGHTLRGIPVSLLAGIFLGGCSSFLGIGGGPINVSLIIYLFSLNTKTATVCSLLTILFAQLSKLGTVALTVGFGGFDFSMLPAMLVGAVAGGFLGASLNKKCAVLTVERAFNGVQLIVLAITVFNVLKNLWW